MSDERYVVVTCVSTFRQRYCVPMSELQKLNTEVPLDTEKARTWAMDEVTMENVKEFSQQHLGEQIIDTMILDEERMLNLFDRDNDYLKDWTKDQKIKHVHNWQDDWRKKD